MGKARKSKEVPYTMVPGQISIFDIDVTKFNKKVTEVEVKTTKLSSNATETKIDKDKRPLKLTAQQEKFLSDNKILENENLSRIIIYACGHIGIELKESLGVKTSIYDRECKLVTEFDKEINVIALDKIYYSSIKYELTDMQLKKLEELKSKIKSYKVIQRFGDRNLTIVHPNGVTSINTKGWVLDYISITDVKHKKEEVLEEDHKEAQEKSEYRIGDKIIVDMIDKCVEAEIFNIYNNGESLSIIYDGKHTATHISRIKKIA